MRNTTPDRTGAITQFGASLQVLLPGAKASIRHWHEHVDKFLFVVSGVVPWFNDSSCQEQGGPS